MVLKKYDRPVIFLRQDCAILSEFAIITGQYIEKLSKLSVYSQLLYVQQALRELCTLCALPIIEKYLILVGGLMVKEIYDFRMILGGLGRRVKIVDIIYLQF